MIDMRDVGSVEVQIKENGGVIWVNVDGVCQLRITKLKNLRIIDERTKEVRKLTEKRRNDR